MYLNMHAVARRNRPIARVAQIGLTLHLWLRWLHLRLQRGVPAAHLALTLIGKEAFVDGGEQPVLA